MVIDSLKYHSSESSHQPSAYPILRRILWESMSSASNSCVCRSLYYCHFLNITASEICVNVCLESWVIIRFQSCVESSASIILLPIVCRRILGHHPLPILRRHLLPIMHPLPILRRRSPTWVFSLNCSSKHWIWPNKLSWLCNSLLRWKWRDWK